MRMRKKQDVRNRLFLKPSPNEQVQLLQDRKEKLRKVRLQQVREQEKALASRVRQKFKEKEKRELILLREKLKREWEDDITEQKTALEKVYLENVSHVGEGHHGALMRQDNGEPKAMSLEEQLKAAERYKQALKKLKSDEAERARLQYEKTEAKQRALEMERIRACKVAALEPPVPDIVESLEIIQRHKLKQKNIDQYSSTYYHLPQELVEKADPNDNQFDARDAAKDEEERIQNAKEAADRNFSEQMEKARLRHKHAKSKLMLQKDHDKLLKELEHFERMDRQRRQNIVSKIPKHVFEPPHRRLEASEERQREIEHAFEDMYMAQTNYMGDISVAKESLPSSPAATDDVLDASVEIVDEIPCPTEPRGIDMHEHDFEEKQPPGGGIPSEPADLPGPGKKMKRIVEEAEKTRSEIRPSGKDSLKRLMKKIDQQRDRWRSMNKMRTVKEDEERHESDHPASDELSEFSEGLLTVTTESTPPSKHMSTKPKETLLHPYEEAERMRAAGSRIEAQGLEVVSSDVEKQKQHLQQQKLKLQLQQQQVLQEHLQLQFDILQHGIETQTEEGKCKEDSFTSEQKEFSKEVDEDHVDVLGKNDDVFSSEHDSLSTGLLSDDGKPISVSDFIDNGKTESASSKEDIVLPSTSRSADSRVDTSVGHHKALFSIPESVFEEEFVKLTPLPNEPPLDILPQQKPPDLNIPTHLHRRVHTPTDSSQPKISSFRISPPHTAISGATPKPIFAGKPKQVDEVERGPVYPSIIPSHFVRNEPLSSSYSKDSLAEETLPQQELPPLSAASAVRPTLNVGTSVVASTGSSGISHLRARFPLPTSEGSDTVSYLQFYQEQLVDQQERIREQQLAIQERQQQRLEQLKQFQEQLRSLRMESRSMKNVTDTTAQWRSLIPNSRASDTGSSVGPDTQSSTELRPADGDFLPQIQQKEQMNNSRTASKTGKSDNDDVTSSSLSPYPSAIVPPRSYDDRVSFPDPSKLGLWSDTTIQLSSSEVTKSSSGVTIEESDAKEQTREDFSSSPLTINNKSSNNLSHGSESTSGKSRSSLESGPLSSSSLSTTHKSLSSSSSDANNNLMLRLESSFQHFQEMIKEAKTLNQKYLSASEPRERPVEKKHSSKITSQEDDFTGVGLVKFTTSVSSPSPEHIEETSFVIGEQPQVHGDDLSHEVIQTTKHSFDQSELGHDDIFKPLETSKDPNGFSNHRSLSGNNHHDGNYNLDEDPRILPPPQDILMDDGIVSLLPVGSFATETNQERPSFEIYPDPTLSRSLSIIPEETHVSDDHSYEGIIENDESNLDTLDGSEWEKEKVYKPLDMLVDIDENIDCRDDPAESTSNKRTTSYNIGRSPKNDNLVIGSNREENHSTELKETHGANLSSSRNLYEQEGSPPGTPTASEVLTASKPFQGNKQNVPLQISSDYKPLLETTESDFLSEDEVVRQLSNISLSQADNSTTEASDLGLQEAFRRNRSQFIKNSEQRVRAVKEAKFRKPKPPGFHKSSRTPIDEITANSQNDNERNSPAPPLQESMSEDNPGVQSLRTKPRIDKQDMIARNKRLYQNLPEVRKKQLEQQREEMYAENRAKAREFQKQTRERLRKLSEKTSGGKK